MSTYTAGPFSFKGPTINLQTGEPDIISILAPVKENGWSTVLAEITVRNTTEEEAVANAALFAAAPEMLEALYEALPWVEAQLDDPINKPNAVKSVAARIRAAIKKAEGAAQSPK